MYGKLYWKVGTTKGTKVATKKYSSQFDKFADL